MRRSRPVSLALVGLLLWVAGCQTYRQIHLTDLPAHKVRVTLASGESARVDSVRLEGDLVRAMRDDTVLIFHTVSIAELEAKKTNIPLSIGAFVGGAVVLHGLMVVVACLASPGGFDRVEGEGGGGGYGTPQIC